jgi:hypothetical protein
MYCKIEARDRGGAMAGLWSGFRSTPRWVKVFAVAGLVLLVVVIVALLGGHGPSRHGAGP